MSLPIKQGLPREPREKRSSEKQLLKAEAYFPVNLPTAEKKTRQRRRFTLWKETRPEVQLNKVGIGRLKPSCPCLENLLTQRGQGLIKSLIPINLRDRKSV